MTVTLSVSEARSCCDTSSLGPWGARARHMPRALKTARPMDGGSTSRRAAGGTRIGAPSCAAQRTAVDVAAGGGRAGGGVRVVARRDHTPTCAHVARVGVDEAALAAARHEPLLGRRLVEQQPDPLLHRLPPKIRRRRHVRSVHRDAAARASGGRDCSELGTTRGRVGA